MVLVANTFVCTQKYTFYSKEQSLRSHFFQHLMHKTQQGNPHCVLHAVLSHILAEIYNLEALVFRLLEVCRRCFGGADMVDDYLDRLA